MDLLEDAQSFPVTTIFSVGAIASFAAGLSGRSLDHLIINPVDPFSAPWTFITTVFPHGGLLHIFFNVLWIWQLGRVIESRLGTPATLILALLSAAFATAAQLLADSAPIGLSGVVYAFAAFAWARGQFDPKFRGVINEGTRNFFIIWFFFCILLTKLHVMNVANAAHFGGAVIGLALGMRRQWIAPLLVALLGTAVMLRVNVPLQNQTESWQERHRAGKLVEAEMDLRAIIEEEPKNAAAWWNLAIFLHAQGRIKAGNDAFDKAVELEPGEYRQQLEAIRSSGE